jgi:hypothetical protein
MGSTMQVFGKVPTKEFPQGNTPDDFALTVERGQALNNQRVYRNLFLPMAFLVSMGTAGYSRAIGKL